MNRVKGKILKPRHAKFIAEFLRLGVGTTAAIAAGYRPRSAGKTAKVLLRKPEIRAAVEAAQRAMIEKGKYSVEKSMEEAADAMAFAKQTENANALVKAIEHRAKLSGLLVEKVDMRMQGRLSIHISGVDPEPGALDVTSAHDFPLAIEGLSENTEPSANEPEPNEPNEDEDIY